MGHVAVGVASRAMVDICKILLAQNDLPHLPEAVSAAQRAILEHTNHGQLARLRLVQAETALRAGLSGPASPDPRGDAALETAAGYCTEALLAAAETPHLMLSATLEQVDARLRKLAREGKAPQATRIRERIVVALDRALSGATLSIPLSEKARRALQEANLVERWADRYRPDRRP
jgi:hypothetical protein